MGCERHLGRDVFEQKVPSMAGGEGESTFELVITAIVYSLINLILIKVAIYFAFSEKFEPKE